MTTHATCDRQDGFSLVELLTAMAITLIVSGAIYGLMASGQGSFQREPVLTEQQQNGRIAVDLIENDIANAGRGMPLVSQVFTNLLDATGEPGVGVGGAAVVTDELELITADPRCQAQWVCAGSGGTLTTVGAAGDHVSREPISACLSPVGGTPPLILLADARLFSIHTSAGAGASTLCGGVGANNGRLTLSAPVGGFGGGWGLTADPSSTMYAGQVIRYRITPPDAEGIQSLERSETSEIPLPAPAGYQVVARGIDDLQVQYMNGAGAWVDNPGAVGPCPTPAGCATADYNTVVTSVRVIISARTVGRMVAGDNNVVRARLTTVATPRSAVAAMEWAAAKAQVVYN